MRTLGISVLPTAVVVAMGSACDYTHDAVTPGYYGVTQAGSGGAAQSTTSRPASDNTMTATPPIGAAGSAGSTNASASTSNTSPTSTSTMAIATAGSGSAGSQPTNSNGAASCDLSGSWLFTMHKTTDGLGNLQYIHTYLYYEIQQQADSFTVKKSLFCGMDVIGGGDFAVTVTYDAAIAGIMKNVSHNGRTGSSVATSGGCKVDFAKQYTVVGATLPYYLDPSTTLPTADDMAGGGKPGWEDWDSDGNPGVTGVCAGTVTGKIYTAAREWSTMTGVVPNVASVFELPLDWDEEPNVMAFDGSPFLGSSAVRAADASLHFVQFARLQPNQVSGDDAALCKSLVALGPTLTPIAAGM
jgi:hypothetical protein